MKFHEVNDKVGTLSRLSWTGGNPDAPITRRDLMADDWTVTPYPPPPAPTPPAPSPAPAPAPKPTTAVQLRGVNISGGEYGAGGTRGYWYDYVYPQNKEIDYYASKGIKLIRVPFLDKRILADWDKILPLINYAGSKGMDVVLDLHQFGSMAGGQVGIDAPATMAFQTLWQDVNKKLIGVNNVRLGLMNEPNKQSMQQWWPIVTDVAKQLLSVVPTRKLAIPGTAWTGAEKWTSNGNSVEALKCKGALPDNADVWFELHQYLDQWSTGKDASVVVGKGATCLKSATDWARLNKVKLFLGEFGFAVDAASMKEGNDLVSFLIKNADVWAGWTYWCGGSWVPTYMFNCEPVKGVEQPQMAVLIKAA